LVSDKLDKSIKRLDIKLDKLREKIKSAEDLETYEGVLDKLTLKTLLDLVNNKKLTSLYGVISTGKEANIYWGKKDELDLAIKIYRTMTKDFKKMQLYIIGDPRFKKIKKSTRALIYAWALKEFKNLKRAHSAGLKVPEPYLVKNNVLIMEFIGENGKHAPLLKYVELENPEKVYEKTVEFMKKLFNISKLVHADLSEFNILYFNKEPIIIDMSQSLLTSHPMAMDFLKRDIKNILKFFKIKGVEKHTEGDLLKLVIGG
jgi:RIO kinase 1